MLAITSFVLPCNFSIAYAQGCHAGILDARAEKFALRFSVKVMRIPILSNQCH